MITDATIADWPTQRMSWRLPFVCRQCPCPGIIEQVRIGGVSFRRDLLVSFACRRDPLVGSVAHVGQSIPLRRARRACPSESGIVNRRGCLVYKSDTPGQICDVAAKRLPATIKRGSHCLFGRYSRYFVVRILTAIPIDWSGYSAVRFKYPQTAGRMREIRSIEKTCQSLKNCVIRN